MTVMFAAVWSATAILLPTAILVLFGRALWLGIAAHTLQECATFPVTPAKRVWVCGTERRRRCSQRVEVKKATTPGRKGPLGHARG
jgi:hypothetical protein